MGCAGLPAPEICADFVPVGCAGLPAPVSAYCERTPVIRHEFGINDHLNIMLGVVSG